MKRPLRTLFYGLRHEHAPGKLDTLLRLRDDFEIVAVADDALRASASYECDPLHLEGLRILPEAEARKLPNVDCAFIETANADLMDVAAYFVERGIPIHCDKPCGEDLVAYQRLVEACRRINLPFQIGYMYRGNPAVRFAQKAVADGLLGEIVFIEADMNHDYGRKAPGYLAYLGSFRDGIFYNLGCHLVDMIVPMVRGPAEILAHTLSSAPGDPSGSGTAATALMRFGPTEVLLRMSSNMPGAILCRRLRIDGTLGTLDLCPIERFDGRSLVLTLTTKDGLKTMDFGVQTDRYAPQLLDFAAIVRGDKPNDQDYERDLRTHEITLQVGRGKVI